jgi:hypothetical protein
MEMVADIAPEHVRSTAAGPSKRRVRLRTLTRVDKRTALGRRISELREMFVTTLTSAGIDADLPMRKLRIEQAAQATALAELVRGRYMREGTGDLDELVRAERRADALIKRLGLPPEPDGSKPRGQASLASYLATKAASG